MLLPTRRSLRDEAKRLEIALQKLSHGIDTFVDDDADSARRSINIAVNHVTEARMKLEQVG